MSHQAVFLFDVNAFNVAKLSSDKNLEIFLSYLRLVCLRLLTQFTNVSKNFRFGIKFYNQANSAFVKEKHAFYEVDLESFENLEKKVNDRYTRHASYVKKLSHSELKQVKICNSNSNVSPARLLNIALTEILCDYQWNSIDICSPITRKRSEQVQNLRKNYIFLFSSCPHDLLSYCGVNTPLTAEKLKNFIMPDPLFKKVVIESGINLIWLDTSTLCESNCCFSDDFLQIQNIVENAMRNLHGVILPLSLFSLTDSSFDSSGNNRNSVLDYGNAQHSILPFSELFTHFISGSQIRHDSNVWDCQLILPNGMNTVMLKTTELKNSRSKNSRMASCPNPLRMSQEYALRSSPSLRWCKFSVKGFVKKAFYGIPDAMLIYKIFRDNDSLNEHLFLHRLLQGTYLLVLDCETEENNSALGLLYPLSSSSGIVSVYNPLSPLYKSNVIAVSDVSSTLKDKVMQSVENNRMLEKKASPCNKDISCFLKSFQMASLEKWFLPTKQAVEVGKIITRKISKKDYEHLESMLKNLQHEYRHERKRKVSATVMSSSDVDHQFRRSPRFKRLKSDSNLPSYSITKLDSYVENLSLPDLKDKAFVIAHIKKMYRSAISPLGSLFSSAHSIVEVVLSFLKAEHDNVSKEDLLSFMEDNMLLSPKNITDMYDGKTDGESGTKRAKEYEMQVLLHMEMEAAFPHFEANHCIHAVVALLRQMLFMVGHAEVTQCLKECLKENYNDNLHHILEEIEEELGVSFVGSPDSRSSPMHPISPETTRSSFSFGSVPSCQSSSSVSSLKDGSNKRLSLSQSAFSSISHSRQIVVPSELLRKPKELVIKKPKTEPTAIRRSPRISAQNGMMSTTQPTKVRRNLFSTESNFLSKVSKTPSPSRKRKFTPKGHHVLKTEYVPETPSPKQGISSVRSKLAHLRKLSGAVSSPTVTEVAESPTILDKKKVDQSASSSGTKSKTLRDRAIEKCAPHFSPSPSTKESIRRCSKRLFQNNSLNGDTNEPGPSQGRRKRTKPNKNEFSLRPCSVVLKDIADDNAIMMTPKKTRPIAAENSSFQTPVNTLKGILRTPTPKKISIFRTPTPNKAESPKVHFPKPCFTLYSFT